MIVVHETHIVEDVNDCYRVVIDHKRKTMRFSDQSGAFVGEKKKKKIMAALKNRRVTLTPDAGEGV